MTQILQLLVVAGGLAALVGYGFFVDKKEHKHQSASQGSLDFNRPSDADHVQNRGAAMSHTVLHS
jgi:hypothetical protein